MGIGSVNTVPQATSAYAQQRIDETAQLRTEVQAQRNQLSSLEGILDMFAAGNPHMERILEARRVELGIPPPRRPTAEEEAEAERRSQDFFEDLNN